MGSGATRRTDPRNAHAIDSGSEGHLLSCWGVLIFPAPYAESVDPGVQCSSCEAVCCRLTVVLMPGDHVPEWLVHRDAHGPDTLAKGEDGWCAAVDPNTFRCTIYDERPEICRKFAMGSPCCRDERAKWRDSHALPTPVVLSNR